MNKHYKKEERWEKHFGVGEPYSIEIIKDSTPRVVLRNNRNGEYTTFLQADIDRLKEILDEAKDILL